MCYCFKDGDTPLHLAARSGHANAAHVLLLQGADVKLANNVTLEKLATLFFLSYLMYITMSTLFRFYCFVCSRFNFPRRIFLSLMQNGDTPFHVAAYYGHTDVMLRLLGTKWDGTPISNTLDIKDKVLSIYAY